MHPRIGYAILAGLVFVACAQATDAPSGRVISFSVAKDGSGWATIRTKPYLLEVKKNERLSRVQLTELGSVTDVVPSPIVEWSWDGQFLMVKYLSEESASTIEIFESGSLKRVARFPADDAKWLLSAHRLIVVEANPDLDLTKTQRGLIVFDPLRNERIRIAEGYVFIGKVDTGIRHALAQSLSKRGDEVKIEPVNVSIPLEASPGR